MKCIPLLLTALLAAALLCTGCNDTDIPPETTAAPTTTAAPETEAPITDLEIVRDGVCNYTIVRGDNATQADIDAAMAVRKMIIDETGATPTITTDWVKRGDEHNHDTLEILVGTTAYSESAKALEGLPYGDYIITRVDNKIIVNAWSDQAMINATNALKREVASIADTGSLTLPADMRITGTAIKLANAVPAYVGADLSAIYHSGNQNQVLIFEDTDADEYAAYRKALEGAGFTLYTENDIVDNRFATYINDKYVINAGYYAYEDEARIIVELKDTLPWLESENVYEDKGVQSSFSMIGLEESGANGMSFVFQLVDGSYIIFDGGFNKDRDASHLYQYLRQHAPDPNNITIAAWIITHSHGDHYGCYYKFTDTYASKVKLEYVIGNFPSDEARIEGGVENEGGAGPNIEKRVSKYDGAKFIKTHVGHEFFIRNARIEVLYTLESYGPRILDYLNTSSLICRVEIGGQVFNITGDASNHGCDIARRMYGDYLKADFVQVCHHGYTTGSSAYNGVTGFYDASAAPVVIWPVADKEISGMLGRAYDAHLYNAPTTKEVFVAGGRDLRLLLPYTVGTSGQKSTLRNNG